MMYIADALRASIIKRAHGRCEYCLMAQDHSMYSFHVDHIIPQKHRGATTEDNLCLACRECNHNKGSDFASIDPDTGEIVPLFNPRQQAWRDHFRLDGARIVPISLIGQATVFILKMNEENRLGDRQVLVETGDYPPG